MPYAIWGSIPVILLLMCVLVAPMPFKLYFLVIQVFAFTVQLISAYGFFKNKSWSF